MVVETMWPDVAWKCVGMFWESDEGRKETLRQKLNNVIIILITLVSQLANLIIGWSSS